MDGAVVSEGVSLADSGGLVEDGELGSALYSLVLAAPGQPEHASREAYPADRGDRETVFGFHDDARLELPRLPAAVEEDDEGAYEGTHHRSDEGELADALIPSAVVLEDDGVQAEQHI